MSVGKPAASARPWRVAVIAVLLAGFGLALYRLGYQAALGDDAFTLVIAGKDVGELLRLSASEPHPPVFYLLMWGWVRLAGDGEFAGRFVAVWWAALSVALTYRLGRRIATPAVATLAALLLAVSPFFVAYAQQARMYTMVVALCVSSFILMDRLWRGDPGYPGRWWLRAAYALVTLLAVATHFFALFVVAAQCIGYITGSLVQRDSRRLAEWLGLQAAWALAYLPWVAVAYPTLSSYRNELVSRVGLGEAYARTLAAYVAGDGAVPAGMEVVAAAAAVVVLVGVADSLRRGSWTAAGYALLPPALVFVVSLSRPMYFERYMIVALPGYCLLLAYGVVAAGQWRRFLIPLALAAPLVASALVLPGYYAQTRYATAADMRSMTGYLTALAEPGAAVVSNLPPSDPTLAYYYRGSWPLTYLPETGDAAQIERRLADLAATHSEIWYLPYGAERAVVEPWLDAHAARVTDQWYSDAHLLRYVMPPSGGGAATPLVVALGNGATLTGWQLLPPQPRSGEPLLVRLDWVARQPIGADFKVFLQLLDDAGMLWGQWDGQPGNGLRPTSGWTPGVPVSDTVGLVVLPGTPPGRYRLTAGMYDGATGLRSGVIGGGDSITVADVDIAPSARVLDVAAYQMGKRLEGVTLGGLRVAGVSVQPLGSSRQTLTYPMGSVLLVTLFWQSDGSIQTAQTPARMYPAGFLGGEIRGLGKALPVGSYSPAKWRPGEIVRQQVIFSVPLGDPIGRCWLTVGVPGASASLVELRFGGIAIP